MNDFIENNCWNSERLLQVLDSDIVRKICMIAIHWHNKDDFFVWKHSSNGEFSVKSATWIQGNDNQ